MGDFGEVLGDFEGDFWGDFRGIFWGDFGEIWVRISGRFQGDFLWNSEAI